MDSNCFDYTENNDQAISTDQNRVLLQSFLNSNHQGYLWKPSSLGIKCYSQKTKGHIFLTRRILDVCSTDGKRKIEIEYNYSKNFEKDQGYKSKGSSIQNCSFCDTVSLDFEPESTFFDLLMDVQIITVAPANSKIKTHMDKLDYLRPPDLVPYTDTGQKEIDSDSEESRIYSSYNLRHSKNELTSDDFEFYQNSDSQLREG